MPLPSLEVLVSDIIHITSDVLAYRALYLHLASAAAQPPPLVSQRTQSHFKHVGTANSS